MCGCDLTLKIIPLIIAYFVVLKSTLIDHIDRQTHKQTDSDVAHRSAR